MIEIKNVSKTYNGKKKVLKNISFKIVKGEKVGIIGSSGCGKTTIVNLLLRHIEPTSGQIFINGIDIHEYDIKSLRNIFAYTPQNNALFKGTIKENIAYGKPEATDEEIIEAATKARVHKYIMSLPQGYDTVVEEDGGNMSQGQMQLVCIARIMLTHPPMLILDEATSSIDTRTELQIQRAFDEMMKGRTTFIVAHRLSTIKNADQIIVMDQGHIVEIGNHEELLQKQGYYHQLYYSQFETE